MPELLSLFFTPFITALFSFGQPGMQRRQALILSMIMPILLLWKNGAWIGEKATYAWIPSLSIHFYLSIDGVSLLFLLLTAIVIPLLVLTSPEGNQKLSGYFFGTLFFVQGLLGGFFMASDLVLFTLFWEGMLLPAYFLMLLYGGEGSREAALRFLVYMIAGSCLLIAAVLALYFAVPEHTFAIEELHSTSRWVFAVFMLAFAVKTPLFPFHAWLPDAYTRSSASVTILLSALLSKAGIYGIYRIGIKVFPELMQEFSFLLLLLAVAGTLYGAFAAFGQTDFKRVIAYSSLSHVNFILAGLFAYNSTASGGALLQAFNHGITITALFLTVSFLAERLHSTEFSAAGGLSKSARQLCWFTMLFVLASIAVPGTNNFIGELLILFGVFSLNIWWAVLLGLSLIFSCAYMLRFMHKLFFGPERIKIEDLTGRERTAFIVLSFFILWLGVYPSAALNLIQAKS